MVSIFVVSIYQLNTMTRTIIAWELEKGRRGVALFFLRTYVRTYVGSIPLFRIYLQRTTRTKYGQFFKQV